jgi:hypothetical protein
METDEEDLTLEQRRIKQEYPWRLSLKVGDRLDAVLSVHVMQYRISHWARATIIQATDVPD